MSVNQTKSYICDLPGGLQLHRYGGSLRRLRGRLILIDRQGYVVTTRNRARELRKFSRSINFDALADTGKMLMSMPI